MLLLLETWPTFLLEVVTLKPKALTVSKVKAALLAMVVLALAPVTEMAPVKTLLVLLKVASPLPKVICVVPVIDKIPVCEIVPLAELVSKTRLPPAVVVPRLKALLFFKLMLLAVLVTAPTKELLELVKIMLLLAPGAKVVMPVTATAPD